MIERLEIPQLPLKQFISALINCLNTNLSVLFGTFSNFIQATDGMIRSALNDVSPVILIVAASAFLLLRMRFMAALIVGLGLLMVWNIGFWSAALDTLSLLVLATVPTLLFGLLTGILIAEVWLARTILVPVLDLMQTVPAFVYLIPSVLFFGVGAVPGVIATVMFALPPFARGVALGLGEVQRQFIEVGQSVGLSKADLLLKIKLPLATPYILTGLSQCVMISLSMVVIASLIGAPGIGTQVVTSLSQMDFALGIEAGLCMVFLAITIERVLEAIIAGRWIWRR